MWCDDLTVYTPNTKLQYPASCLTDSDDIADTSLGMQEILNLSFKLAMQKLLIPDYPLMLDEVGVNLDTTHRLKLYEYIKQLLFNDYPNAFIISHYKELYSLFDTDTEITVLDSKNIDVSLLPLQPNTAITFN